MPNPLQRHMENLPTLIACTACSLSVAVPAPVLVSELSCLSFAPLCTAAATLGWQCRLTRTSHFDEHGHHEGEQPSEDLQCTRPLHSGNYSVATAEHAPMAHTENNTQRKVKVKVPGL